MSEIVVRVVDKVSEDPYSDAGLTKRGDVIVVVEDGHEWGSGDLSNPHWRIVKLPGVSVAELQGFLAPEPDSDPLKPSRVRHRRLFSLDVDKLRDGLSLKQLVALRSRKVPRKDPNVID